MTINNACKKHGKYTVKSLYILASISIFILLTVESNYDYNQDIQFCITRSKLSYSNYNIISKIVTAKYYCKTDGQPSIAICKSYPDTRIYDINTNTTKLTFVCNSFCTLSNIPNWLYQ
jgi:hypothetical protein